MIKCIIYDLIAIAMSQFRQPAYVYTVSSSKVVHTSLTSHVPWVGRVKIRVKFIAVLPANLKTHNVHDNVGTEYDIHAQHGVDPNPKDHLSSHFFNCCGFCACEA